MPELACLVKTHEASHVLHWPIKVRKQWHFSISFWNCRCPGLDHKPRTSQLSASPVIAPLGQTSAHLAQAEQNFTIPASIGWVGANGKSVVSWVGVIPMPAKGLIVWLVARPSSPIPLITSKAG